MREEDQRSDSELIDACRRGDAAAWEALITRYERLVYTIPYRYGLTPAEVDDVFQTVWQRLVEHLPTLKQPDRVAAWLVTTARHECWRGRRGSDFERTTVVDPEALLDAPAIDAATPEELVARFESARALHAALARLDPRCRRLLALLYTDRNNPTYQEIARQLDMRVGAIGPTRARCLKKLRRLLGRI